MSPFTPLSLEKADPIGSVLALFRHFSPEKPISNAVVCFWESHTECSHTKKNLQATLDLMNKVFDLRFCEKYEVRTGYLSRYNYLSRDFEESTPLEREEAIQKGNTLEEEWVKRCEPDFPRFYKKSWEECITPEGNRYFESCYHLILKKLEESQDFYDNFLKTVTNYASKHQGNINNGKRYVLEELTWILSLPLLHLNKPIFLIHLENRTPAISSLFHEFPSLQKAVKWMSPTLKKRSFQNLADFLLAYRNDLHTGYSYAIENKDSVKNITHFKKRELLNREELLHLLDNEHEEKTLLRSIIGQIPGHIYWLNRDNVYLGCNDTQAKSFGIPSRKDVIGKTNDDFFPEQEARELDKNNLDVMETGKAYEGEELVFMKGIQGNYLSQKVPLYDEEGKIIGVLGMSFDITERKRAQELEFQNKIQKVRIKEQEEFRSFTARVAHDIASPLLVLDSFLKNCRDLSGENHSTLRSVVKNIKEISKTLLDRHKKDQFEVYAEQEQQILVPLALEEVISHKKYQFKEKPVDFDYSYAPQDKFTFIKGDQSNFSRMISNLLNNAVEAFEGEKGVVTLGFTVKEDQIHITIQDTGKGMPQDIIDKIIKRSPVETTKKDGHGIGLGQVMHTLKIYQGDMDIQSKEGEGTKITLKFPLISPPQWVTDRLIFHKNDIIVMLDDDESLFSVWKSLLSPHFAESSLHFFTKSWDAMRFIDDSYHKNKIFFLCDYDLKESATGLTAILQTEMKQRSLLVTSIHNDKYIHDLAQDCGIKILPKQYLLDIPILIKE